MSADSASENATSTTPVSGIVSGNFKVATSEFVSQLYISIPIGVSLILLYCILRKFYFNTFEAKRQLLSINGDQLPNGNDNDNNKESTKPLITYPLSIDAGESYFYWMYSVFAMDINTFYIHAGFDALIMKLYLHGCLYTCLLSLPYALLVLLPLYATSDHDHSPNHDIDMIDILSITTVQDSDHRMISAVIGSYLFTLIALYFLSRVYLCVSYATDQFFVGNCKNATEIDKLSWFNYKHIAQDLIDMNLSMIERPMNATKDVVSSVHKMIDKRRVPMTLENIDISMEELDKSDDSGDDEEDYGADADDEDAAAPPIYIANDNNDNSISSKNNDEKSELLNDKARGSSDDLLMDLDVSVPPISKYTVMIRDLPMECRNESTLYAFMDSLFPNKIEFVTVISDVFKLSKIDKRIELHRRGYDKYVLSESVDFERTICCGCCGERVKSLKFHRNRHNAYLKERNALIDALPLSPTAFVTFSDLETASMCVSCPIRLGFSNQFSIECAVSPSSLIWENLRYCTVDLIPNRALSNLFYYFVMVFWSIPVAATQGLANLSNIFKFFGGNVDDAFSDETQSVLQGLLTVLVLDCWLMVLPLICAFLVDLEHHKGKGIVEIRILNKYFDYLLVMVLFVTVISNISFYTFLNNSFSEILSAIAHGLANMSTYFLLYVLLNAFIWLPLELYRPSYYILKFMHFDKEIYAAFSYSTWFAKTMLILVILLTYGVMSPIMFILGAIYFTFAIFVFTYHLAMSWVPMAEIGANVWCLVFDKIVNGLYISIFTLIGLFILKQSYYCAISMFPCIYLIHILSSQIDSKFKDIFKCASLNNAKNKDLQLKHQFAKSGKRTFNKNAYLPPILRKKYKKIYSKNTSNNRKNDNGNNNNNNDIQMDDRVARNGGAFEQNEQIGL